MFEELVTAIHDASQILQKLEKAKNKSTLVQKIRSLESHADTICHRLHQEAERTFITPIDREDIQVLTKRLDNIIDAIEEVATKLVLYNGKARTTREFQDFAKLVGQTTQTVATLIPLLKHRDKHIPRMKKLIHAIHTLENEGDVLIRKALSSLFARQKNATTIIKWKDIYETLEMILDEAEDTADTVEAIIIKNF